MNAIRAIVLTDFDFINKAFKNPAISSRVSGMDPSAEGTGQKLASCHLRHCYPYHQVIQKRGSSR